MISADMYHRGKEVVNTALDRQVRRDIKAIANKTHMQCEKICVEGT